MNSSAASEPRPERAASRILVIACAVAVGAISFGIFWLTAYRNMAWWNGDYSLAAATLGVPAPPGSLLLTLLGWLALRLPIGYSQIFTLNLFAGVIAAVAVSVLTVVAISMYRNSEMKVGGVSLTGSNNAVVIGAALGVLTLAFSASFWTYATRFTPYILTALFTTLILLALMKWWRRADTRTAAIWLMVVALLFGLDFSVHRTNLLMLPGLLFVVILRRPRTLISAKSWGLGLAGFIGGLAVHLLLIPIAAARPFINIGNPSTWTSFWDYVSLKQMGGGFLVDVYPRKAPMIAYQLNDYLSAFASNFLSIHGWFGILGVLPFLLGIVGFLILWRRNWKLGAAMTILFLLTSAGAVAYFNIPEDFYRSFDRHYLPSFVIFAGFIAYGAAAIVSAASYEGAGIRPVIAGLIVLLAPAYLFYQNYGPADRSNEFFAYDYATNILVTLPENAIVITSGDNDTFPLWYLQGAENVRRDVTVINRGLMNTPWFMEQVLDQNAGFPLSLKAGEIWGLRPKPWHDTVITVPAPADVAVYDLPETYAAVDSIGIEVPPTLQDKFLMVQDQLLLDIIRTNNWTRPIYFTYPYSWLGPHLRQEGVAWRLLPVQEATLNREILRHNLFDAYVYRGFADPGLPVEFTTRNVAMNLMQAFTSLASGYAGAGDSTMCAETMAFAYRTMPPERIEMPVQMQAQLADICVPPVVDTLQQTVGTAIAGE